jgi:hypothetical protein
VGKHSVCVCCDQPPHSKRMVTDLPAMFAQVVLDSQLQVNLCVRAARRSADADHRAKGTKEGDDLQRKETR